MVWQDFDIKIRLKVRPKPTTVFRTKKQLADAIISQIKQMKSVEDAADQAARQYARRYIAPDEEEVGPTAGGWIDILWSDSDPGPWQNVG
jgi:hypothetical protein